MSQIGLNLSKFKKISENEKSATLQHPAGHKIIISKKLLSPDMHQELSKLPLHLAEGTPEEPIASYEPGTEPQQPEIPEEQYVSEKKEEPEAAADLTPEQKALRETYNHVVEAKYAPKAAMDPEVGMQNNPAQDFYKKMRFGENGEAPESFDTKAWQKSKDIITSQQNLKAAQEKESAAREAQENIAKAEAGISMPQAKPQAQMADASQNQAMSSMANAPIEAAPAAPSPQAASPAAAPSGIPITQAQVSPNDPYGTSQNFMQAGMQNQQAGILGKANAEAAMSQRNEGLYHQQAQQDAALQKMHMDNYQSIEQERQAARQDIKNGFIDPNHFLNSMGTPQKIATGIGLILGGMGGGLAHQQNLAASFLEQQINNDLNAQAKNLGAKENLLSSTMQQFGNLNQAMSMSRIIMRDHISDQLAESAAKAGTPLAQHNAQIAIGELQSKNAQEAGQLALKKTMMDSISGNSQGGAPSMDASNKLTAYKMAGMIDPGQYEAGMKEVGVLDAKQKALNAADDIIRKSAALQSTASRVGSPIQSAQQLDTLGARLTPLIMEAAPSKRLTPESAKLEIMPFLVKWRDSPGTVEKKLADLKQYIITMSDPTPILRGLRLDQGASQVHIAEGAPIKPGMK